MNNLERYLSNLYIATEALLSNKMRTMLTALGIIFGVAAVIAMLAVGNGAQQEVLEQIKLVGVNNIVVTPVVEQVEENVDDDSGGGKEKVQFSPGLTLLDAKSVKKILPTISKMSPEILLETQIVCNGIRRSAKLVGVEPSYFDIYNFNLAEGREFNEHNLAYGDQVCIIGRGIKSKFFSKSNPIGKYIKCGPHWLKIIGVMEERMVSKSSISSKLGIRDFNMDVYTPIQTILTRYKNRALITASMIRQAAASNGGFFIVRSGGGDEEDVPTADKNYHQLDKLVVQVEETEYLNATADVIARMLERRHFRMVDYEITIPELLLKQQQRTKDIFNIVLGAIAGISLIVGGIGIMNIMLASVMERIKEIGLRISLGAKRIDIVLQFLFESVMISLSGGLIGVILGVSLALIIAEVADIPTIISPGSIIVSFAVAAGVGLIFGITPAKRAADQDPITSLRHE
ncbi:ABC transporter permease [Flammeovirgaceae bacterium SG7u.111]|nr:ABC transporter permease [Flammeovirgaceae bacterium SG7u.132]WPO38763.1 ABC transporter permease [Flammeovirgaceae bacterium SG7u.111]